MRLAAAIVLSFAAMLACALEVVPPPYRARTAIEGTIRVAGNPEAKALVDAWERGFRREHPEVRIERDLRGSDVGMASLYTGQADLVLMGRAATAPEVKAFEWIYRYRPLAIEVATGSVDQPGRSPALAVYVHADNPLAKLTLAQLDAVFSRERLRGASATIARWGDLGVGGAWAQRAIGLYTFDTESGTGRFFRETVLKDSRMLDWDRITESPQPIAALLRDRYGLAVASGRAPSGLKIVAIAGDDGMLHSPTREEIAARRYPLARAVFAYVNRKPQGPLDAPVAAFLDYALGPQGQQDVDVTGIYLPLTSDNAREQAARLR